MDIVQSLVTEWKNESANTRKMLERIPEDKLGWKATPKAMSIGGLATHISQIPWWSTSVLKDTSYRFTNEKMTEFKSVKEILDNFDKNAALLAKGLSEMKLADLDVLWTLYAGDHKIFESPRHAVIRGFLFSHIIHHRGYLGAYLKVAGVKVPGMYGPGDE